MLTFFREIRSRILSGGGLTGNINIAATVAIIVCVISLSKHHHTQVDDAYKDDRDWVRYVANVTNIRISEWNSHTTALSVIKNGESTLFSKRGHRPAEHIPAIQRWKNDSYLESAAGDGITNVYRHKHREFVYYNIDEEESEDGFIVDKKLAASTFFSLLKEPGAPYMYYSGAMSMWPGLQSDAAHVRDLFCARTMRDKCVKTQLWISEKDVITTAHYDAAHNFFTQIRGFKRIDLWPIASGMGERRAKRHVCALLVCFLVMSSLTPQTEHDRYVQSARAPDTLAFTQLQRSTYIPR